MKLIYSDDAVAYLVRLRNFIAENNPDAARRIAEDLVARLEQLSAFPRMGHAVELAPDPDSIRDAIFGNYIVRYSIHAASIIVLRIWHHREHRESDL